MSRKRKKPVSLAGEQRERLEGLIAGGNVPVRKTTHARILLKADEGASQGAAAWPDTRIAEALAIGRSTVARVRERFVARRDRRPLSSTASRKGASRANSTAPRRRI